MNILGVDYGKKRIGLAWTDTAIGVVLPFGVVKNNESRIMNQELVDVIEKEKVDRMIVGLPVGLDGKENANTTVVRVFVQELKKLVRIPIEFIDERFTSAQADRMSGGDATRDEKAAMVILQSFIDRKPKS